MVAFILFLTILISPWTWKILESNFLIFLAVVTASYLIVQKTIGQKIKWQAIFLIFGILLFFQFKTTQVNDLFRLNDVEKTIQTMRMREYPYPRIAHIIEERKESIAFFRIEKNLFENLDLNLYFFGNHPRSRVGYQEFEKFWFVLIPFFIIGLIHLIGKKKHKELAFVFFIPLIFLSIIGNQNPIGPFSLFPFFLLAITEGIYYVFEKKS